MKQTIINTFAAIGVITTFVLACSAALEESSISMKEGTYHFQVDTRAVYVINTDTGEMMYFDRGDYFDLPYQRGTWVDVVSNPVE